MINLSLTYKTYLNNIPNIAIHNISMLKKESGTCNYTNVVLTFSDITFINTESIETNTLTTINAYSFKKKPFIFKGVIKNIDCHSLKIPVFENLMVGSEDQIIYDKTIKTCEMRLLIDRDTYYKLKKHLILS